MLIAEVGFWSPENVFLWALVLVVVLFAVFGLRYLTKKTGINTDDLQETGTGIAKKSANEISNRAGKTIDKKVDNFSKSNNDRLNNEKNQ